MCALSPNPRGTDPIVGLNFRQSAWDLARFLRLCGRALSFPLETSHSREAHLRLLSDRLRHLNQIVGHYFPPTRNILACEIVDGFNFAFRPFTDDADRLADIYEPAVRRLLSPASSEVILDVGANIGRHALWLSRKVGPCGIVLAIEPERENFKVLEVNRRINTANNLVLARLALGSSSGKATVMMRNPTSFGKVTTMKSADEHVQDIPEVNLQTLDDIVKAYALKKVSAIKIDVEGAELSVLEGAKETIVKFRPRLVIEVHKRRYQQPIGFLLNSMEMSIHQVLRAGFAPDDERVFILAVPSGPE